MQDSTLLTVNQVATRLSVTRVTVYRLRDRDPEFPAPIYIAPRSPRWRSEELTAWIDRVSANRAA